MGFTNYHGHCYYCDGKGKPSDYITEAIRQQMPVYGFSSHAPLPYALPWPMQEADSLPYTEEIAQLKAQYADQIEVYTGMEVDFIPGVAGPNHARIRRLNLDYTIGSVHFVDFFEHGNPWEIDGSHQVFLAGYQQIFQGNIEKAVRRYYALIRQMVEQDKPDIVGHLDKIKIQSEEGQLFSEHADWYREEIDQTLATIAKAGVIVEVNTRGLYKKKSAEPYPSYWIVERMHPLGIPVILNADAHAPGEITAHFEEVAGRLQQIGYRHFRILRQGRWQDTPFTDQGI